MLMIVLKDKFYVLKNSIRHEIYTKRLEAIASDICWRQIIHICRPGARAFTLERVYSRSHAWLPMVTPFEHVRQTATVWDNILG